MKQYSYTKIAQLAGVSQPTVSRVINGTPGVSQEKCERVIGVLKELNFTRPVRHRKTRLKIGLLLKQDGLFDSAAIFRKILAILSELPRTEDLLILNPSIQPEELLSRYLKQELHGVLIVGFSAFPPEMSKALARIPHIWLNSHTDEKEDYCILGGNELGGRMAARFLITKKCKVFMVLDGRSITPAFHSHIDGFEFELYSRKIKTSKRMLHLPEGMYLENAPEEELEKAMKAVCTPAFFHKVDGIFMAHPRLVPMLYRVHSQVCPEQALPQVISCGHIPEYLTGLYPRPAAIDLSPEDVALLALRRLIRLIEGTTTKEDGISVFVAPRLIKGDRER